MQKVDRLGWAAGLAFEAYGVKAGIRVNDPSLLSGMVSGLPPRWQPIANPAVERVYSLWAGRPSPRPGFRSYTILYRNGLEIFRTLQQQAASDALATDLRLYVGERSRRFVFLHAGVVSWRGRAILLPGRSFSGKSELVASLVRAGATYHSDEYAPLDAKGHVHPFPVPLSLRQGTGERRQSAEQLGGRAATRPVPVGLIVLSRFQRGGRWRPRALSGARALLELIRHTLPVRRQPKRVLRVLQQVVTQVPVLGGSRGAAEEVVPHLLKMVEGLGPESELREDI